MGVLDNPSKVDTVQDRGEQQYRLDHPNLTEREAIAAGSGGSKQVIVEVGQKLDKAHQTSSLFSTENSFIPRARFDEIITPEAVLEIIPHLRGFEKESPARHNELAQDIYYGNGSQGPCRRLLGVLLGIDRAEDLKQHMDDQVSDDCLPMLMKPGTDECILHCRLHGSSHSFINQYPRPETRKHFLQWSRRLTPTYVTYKRDHGHMHYVLEQGDPFPMTMPDASPVVNANAAVCQGGFAEVIPARIDVSGGNFEHHTFLNLDQLFALKRLRHEFGDDHEKHRKVFELEVQSLLYADGRAGRHGGKEVHLIPLLATFEVCDPQTDMRTYYLLFDWAEGNLKDFWNSETSKSIIRNMAKLPWLAEQLYELARALNIMHNDRQHKMPSDKTDSNLYCRHGDIKPSNFLVFPNPDKKKPLEKLFVIGDFGLGRLHSKMSRSKQDPKDIATTATYRPPEFDLVGGKVSPRTDLFSMGCVFLELITWFFYGYEGVEEFSTERLEPSTTYDGFTEDTFFTLSSDRRTAELKDKVKNWIETRLRGHALCSEYLYSMLDIIENGMLHPDSEKRLTSEKLKNKLLSLCKSGKQSRSFYETHWTKTSQ
ncbi:kinase-like domain-containing protein [Lasiosphaeris hirsuta]|uniref:Kinase-like domain-containing protein n=1 Tax=Lasiosphaeris hirsuta TaxID=260670 RepID=A0AA40B0W2_9PEZI|nr:kinase-like domain-containing protein [Lasiosphaeris hirsuta]